MSDPALMERYRAIDAALVGVIREWAEFEFRLGATVLGRFLNTDQTRSRIIWAAMPNWRARRELLATLGETFLEEPFLSRWNSLLKRAKGLGEKRNALAHRTIHVDSKSGKIMLFSDARDREVGFNLLDTLKYDLANIEGWPKAINRLNYDFYLFFENAEIFHLPKMHRASTAESKI